MDVQAELKQANLAIEALNICIKQDDEREAELKRTVDTLAAALEECQRYMIQRPRGHDTVILAQIGAALALARGEG